MMRFIYDYDVICYKFTGKERDSETGLDYFGARYYGSNMGRMQSPDPFIPFNLKKDKFQAWISNPQHWNKYAYALNNPLLYVDPTGMTETIYYWLNSSLTDEQKKYFQQHKTEILNAIADKAGGPPLRWFSRNEKGSGHPTLRGVRRLGNGMSAR